MRGSVAAELGQGLAGHPRNLMDTGMGVHPASQFCTTGQTTGNASSLWALLAPGSGQGSELSPSPRSAPWAPPRHGANFNYLLWAM